MGIHPTQVFHCSVSLSLHTVVVGEIDELEEDVGWWSISCLDGVMDVKEESWRKSSTTSLEHQIGTKFSCYIVFQHRFTWDVVFDSRSILKSIRVHRKAFRASKTAGVPSKTFSQEYNQFFERTMWPLHASALLHWRWWLSYDYTISSKYPISAECK